MQVSIARPGALCSPLPAAVLALTHNFTAAQSMQEPLPAPRSVLDAHAKGTEKHFELARSLFKKVQLSCCHEASPAASWDLPKRIARCAQSCPCTGCCHGAAISTLMCEERLHVQGASEKHVHGHRARSQQRKAAKELRKTSKWAVRELHSLEGLRRRFTQDAQEALRLERWLPAHPAR